MGEGAIIEIEPHTQQKYSILRKYLDVCLKFHSKYGNFVYVDTHGGSGKVLLKDKNIQLDGSPLIAASCAPTCPCHIVEIDPERHKILTEATRGHPNVTTYLGDCNSIINSILGSIQKWRNFVCCFVDPDALVYRRPDGYTCNQLKADTIRAIADFPRSELLLNFPLEALLRSAGVYFSNPDNATAQATGDRLTSFMGSNSWQDLPSNRRRRRDFLDLYVSEILSRYPFKGVFLVTSAEKNLPVYYLVYATHNRIAAKIMRDVMKTESGYTPSQSLRTLKTRTLDETHPLNYFVFES